MNERHEDTAEYLLMLGGAISTHQTPQPQDGCW